MPRYRTDGERALGCQPWSQQWRACLAVSAAVRTAAAVAGEEGGGALGADEADGGALLGAAGHVIHPAAVGAIDRGVSLPDLTDDIRGRPRRGTIDIGAWEFDIEKQGGA